MFYTKPRGPDAMGLFFETAIFFILFKPFNFTACIRYIVGDEMAGNPVHAIHLKI